MQEQERLDDVPFAPGPVEELLRSFLKAARAHQLYLPNNPVYRGAVETLRSAFAPIWGQTDELALSFTETEVRWHGRVVLEESGKSSDSLPWLFYKDGVREIRLSRGFEAEELTRLLEILQRVRKAAPDEDDLLTMLWEADFSSLRYRYVDMSLEAAAPLADGGMGPSAEPQAIQQAAQEAVEESRAGVVSMAEFDGTLYFLDQREIEYIKSEVEREYASDLRRSVVATLLDIYEQQGVEGVRSEVSEHLDTLMLHLLAAGQLRTVAYLIREAKTAAERGTSVSAEQRERLTQIPARLSAAEALSQLLQAMDEAADLPPQEEIAELFEQLRPSALGTVLSWLPRLQNPRLRPMLEEAAGRLARANTAELVRLILSSERTVVTEAIRRSGALQAQGAVPPLGKIIAESDAELRLLAVQALGEIGSAGAMQVLERAVEDEERDIRVATVKILAARAHRPALSKLEPFVKGRSVRAADLTEKMTFFEAYGSLCGDAGVPFLDGLLNGKGFFGRREDSELRACAAMALGRVGTPRAQEALRRAAGEQDKDVVVRNAVNRGLRGGQS